MNLLALIGLGTAVAGVLAGQTWLAAIGGTLIALTLVTKNRN
jgi:hypothetical protein